ncbi:MAG: Nif11-like leader peptide family natural product precursor [Eggerthellaceae bacterium]|nr:Nif11-like leader peptide family natural product precursor [Eggerthellaceae bacterium]
MNFDDLTDEQKAKARSAKTPEEILELAKEEGYELSDDELEAVSGGWCGDCSSDGQLCGTPYLR